MISASTIQVEFHYRAIVKLGFHLGILVPRSEIVSMFYELIRKFIIFLVQKEYKEYKINEIVAG